MDENERRAFLEMSAMLGAHERLIRDLLVNVIGRASDPLTEIESYIDKFRSSADPIVSAPGFDPAQSDQFDQMTKEALDKTLTAARKDLLDALRQAYQRLNKSASQD